MKKLLWVVAFGLIGLGLEEPTANDYIPFSDAYLTLQAEYPTASNECLTIAASTMVGDYDLVQGMMNTEHGKCAVRVLGLLVRVDVNGDVQ